ncbi:unnamed protein product [Candida verbasci]|uniref:RING-type E3 ubiquitin transferase n=1 Tax=Candida verbasci TaxID=1227364 RepID=A0A9W4TZZ7_9ASCO|nr:unnamed protein product [Candida verbasci]
MSTDVENTCRVCRGEGTPNQPLYHPCKCRGSIKYIHQQCLMEWLKHSNKSTEKCEICNTTYKFKIIYDPQMPQNIPFQLIWLKFFKIILSTLLKSTSIMLYILCILFQVPLFWKFVGRIFTWAIDGNLPIINKSSFFTSLLFGEFDITKYMSEQSSNLLPLQLSLIKFRKFLSYTYFSGVRYLLVAVIVQIALFIEREWVVRDEAYLKALKRKIGKEPRTKLIDMLQQTVESLRNNTNENTDAATVSRLESLTRAINDLQENNEGEQGNNNYEESLRRAIDNGELFTERQNEEPNDDAVSDIPTDNERPTIFIGPDHNQEPVINHEARRNAGMNELVRNFVDFAEDNEDNDEDDEEEEEEVQHEEHLQDGAAPANNNGAIAEFLEIFGISLNLSTPIFLMLLCDLVIAAYLFCIYLVPHMIGNIFVSSTGYLLKFVYNIALSKAVNTLSTTKAYQITSSIVDKYILNSTNTGSEFVDFSIYTVNEYVIQSTISMIDKLFVNNMSEHAHTLNERIIVLTIGYGIICGATYKLMTILTSGSKPVLGTPRRAFKVLFEICSTAKVFIIFAIEIYFFPVYCGWLLDFCIAPLFLNTFTQPSKNGLPVFTLLFTSYYEFLQEPYLRISLYWACGTLYMLFFAFYLGMIRNNILRPGVLFFLRTPDDPNTRLIHDALIKPFSLQIYRIWLIGIVYTIFILLGVGGVTWGIRWLVQAKDYNVFLPIQIPSYFTLGLSIYFGALLVDGKSLITKYVKLYWTRVFEISTHKLRLSHFILGKPISHERGYVVYKNLWQQLLGTAKPDYSRPVSYREAQIIFKQDLSVNACFVPNGNYVRAPDNDLISSEKFVRSLFVPVTKDDKVLVDTPKIEELQPNPFDSDDDELDEEIINSNNSYTIVYRPPFFKMRCIALIVMVWIFAVILIISILMIAVFIGRPIVRVNSLMFENFISNQYNKLTAIDWKLVDLLSVAIGLVIQLQVLYQYDKNNDIPNEAEEDNVRRLLNAGRIFNRLPQFILVKFSSCVCWALWVSTIHHLCVEDPYKYTTKSNEMFELKSMVLHFIASFYTLLPIIYYLLTIIKSGDVNNNMTIYDSCRHFGLFQVLTNFAIVHLPSISIILISKYYNSLTQDISKYVWPITFGFFMVIKTILFSTELYSKINDQVKSEKYVKGRTIENIDVSDDDE